MYHPFFAVTGVFGLLSTLGAVGILAVVLGFVLMLVAIGVAYSSRPATIASFLPLAFIPLLLGSLSALIAIIQGLTIISLSGGNPKPNEIAAMITGTLASGVAGLLATLIPFSILAIGLAVKSWNAEHHSSSSQ